MIRLATDNDIEAIRKIAVKQSKWVGFVRRNEIIRGIENRELYVADVDGCVAGFVNWHQRRDGWSTVYALAVSSEHQGKGIGRALLYTVPCPMTLKCMDNNPANQFYQHAGMRLTHTEPGRKHALNVYEMHVLNIIVRGANKAVPAICRASGSAYGAMEKDKPEAWPFMADVEFITPDWEKYMRFIRQYKPAQALVVDYSDPAQKSVMLDQVQQLRDAGVLRVVVCAKFHGAAKDIPEDCIVGVSLRTNGKLRGNGKFAGFMPNFWELIGRRCHLLGGSPNLQKETINKLHGVGARVISVDGNSQFASASMGSVYHDGKWRRKRGEKAALHEGAIYSSQNIQRELNSAGLMVQPPLFADTFR